MRLLTTLGTISCIAIMLSSTQAQDRDTLVEREANTLQAITLEPGQVQRLWLGGGAPFPEHRDQFDAAFAACRQALKASPQDTQIRVNLGALYLWRDILHPDESGNLEKAIDQFLIVLDRDPSNEVALAYLGSYEVLTRVRTQLGEKGMAGVRSALQHTLKDPPGAANLRAFAQVTFFDGRMIEALAAAEALTELSPQISSQLLLGAVNLKSSHADKALAVFQAVLKVAHDPVEVATAKLGAAQAYKALGNTEEADRMLTDVTASLAEQDLDHAARAAGLETPAELGWSIGKAYVAEGNVKEAADYLNPEEVSRYASDMASQKNTEGVKLFNANDLMGARNEFWAAAQLMPTNPVFWSNAGRVSFDLDRYRESMIAFRRAGGLEQLSLADAKSLAVCQAVLGDYQAAQATFEKAEQDFTDDPDLAHMSASTWAVALAYAVGGWDKAEDAWSRLVLHGGNVPWADRYDIFIHVWWGVRTIGDRAKRQDARYQTLRHESVLYHILGEGLKRSLLSQEGIKQVTLEREGAMNRIIDLYRRLSLKPTIPPDVQELVQKAQPFLDLAVDDQESARKAIALYQEVTERAPWWPEGHYTLALLFGGYSNDEAVDREINAFLAVISEGPDAVRARQMQEAFRKTRIFTGPDIER